VAESVVKAAVIFDTAQLQQGVQTSVEGLQKMAEQATVTSDTMKSKSQAMAAAAMAAAANVSEADMKIAASTKLSITARAELAKAMKDVRAGAGEESDAITLLAAAQQKARVATAELAESQKALATINVKPFEDVGERLLTGAAGYIAAAASIRMVADTFKEAVNSSLDFGEAISRASQKTGLSAQTLSVLHYAAATTGGDFDGMSKAVSKLDKNIGEAADGNVKMAALFQSLGLNAKDLAGNTDGASIALARVAEVLSHTEGPRRQQLAMELLGKAGADSIPTLIQVGSNWEGLTDKTKAAGVMLDGETAEALESTSQRMKDLDQHVAGAKLAFTDGLNPGLNAFLGLLGHGNGQVSIFNSLGRDMVSMLNGAVAAAFAVGAAMDGALGGVEARMGLASASMKAYAASGREAASAAAALQAAQNPGAPTSPLAKEGTVRGGTDGGGDGGWQGNSKEETAAAAAAAVKTAAEAKMAAMVQGRELEQQEGFNSVKLDHDYWAARINEFAKGSAQYIELQKRITQDDVEGAKAAHNAIAKFQENQKRESGADPGEEARVAQSANALNKKLEEQAEDVMRTGSRWEGYRQSVAKGAEEADAQMDAQAEANVKLREASGELTPLAAAQELAMIHAQGHARALNQLEKELEAVQAQIAAAPKNALGGASIDPAMAKQEQELQNKIAAAKASAATQATKDEAAGTKDIAKPYLQAFDQINGGWMRVQNDLIQGNRRIGQDFREMALHMVQNMAAGAEKMLADVARTEIRKVMMHRLTATQIATTDAAGAATSDSISAASAMKQTAHKAAVAAAGAWAALADIPIVGPALGAVAAAATWTGVMALAAFEQGGIVGGSSGSAVPILAHAGERVLSSSQTSKFESMVNSNNSSGGDTHFHMGGNTINGGSSSSPTVNDKQFARTVQRLQRQGSIAPARRSILS
jgi:hypothetical protein